MRVALSSVIAVAATAGVAVAGPDDLVSRPLVLAPGQLEAALTLETDLGPGTLHQPTSIAPDLWYGATDRLTLGLVHSANALGLVGDGDGWCPTLGCEQAYSDLGVDARWSLARGSFSAAARVRLVTRRWDPWLPSARVGALVRWQRGRVAIVADPQLQIGLLHTDLGNRAQLNVPLWIYVQPTCRWAPYLRTGVRGELAVFGDDWGVPAALGVRVAITPEVDLAAEAGLVRAGGPLNESKLRVAWISVDLRWP